MDDIYIIMNNITRCIIHDNIYVHVSADIMSPTNNERYDNLDIRLKSVHWLSDHWVKGNINWFCSAINRKD